MDTTITPAAKPMLVSFLLHEADASLLTSKLDKLSRAQLMGVGVYPALEQEYNRDDDPMPTFTTWEQEDGNTRSIRYYYWRFPSSGGMYLDNIYMEQWAGTVFTSTAYFSELTEDGLTWRDYGKPVVVHHPQPLYTHGLPRPSANFDDDEDLPF